MENDFSSSIVIISSIVAVAALVFSRSAAVSNFISKMANGARTDI